MKKKLTFNHLVEKIATETGAPKKRIHDLLNETITLNQEELSKEGHNNINGLGRFSLKWQKPRTGRNPKTGESIAIAGHNTINFKPQASLRNHINRHFSRIKSEPIEKDKKQTTAQKPTPPILKQDAPSAKKKIETNVQAQNEKPKIEKKQEKPKVLTPDKSSSPAPRRKTKRHYYKWIWPVLFILLLILLYIFWPSEKLTQPIPKKKALTEKATKDAEPESKVPVKNKEVTPSKTLEKKKITSTPSTIYKPKEGDYLYRIALDYYKEASLWPIIYKANKNLSPNPERIIIGKDFKLPSLEGDYKNLTINDIKIISEGYLEVYKYYKDKDHKKAIAYLWVANKLDPKVLQNSKSNINEKDFELVTTIEGDLKIKTQI